MVLTTGSLAVDAAALRERNYGCIIQRNIFGLRPAPPPSPPPTAPARSQPLPQVRLTGMTDLLGRSVVLLEISNPGQPVKRPILAEGEAADEVEVLKIDLASAQVRMRIASLETNITFAPQPLPSPTASTHRVPLPGSASEFAGGLRRSARQ